MDQNYEVMLSKEEVHELGYVVAQGTSLLFDQIRRISKSEQMIDQIIFVEAQKNKTTKDATIHIMNHGFHYNGVSYLRFGKSQAQGKNGITAFVHADIWDELFEATTLGEPIGECVIPKYEAQRCLPFSNCTIIPDYMPRIIIIDEYQKVLKDQWIKYVVLRDKEFIDEETGETKKYTAREIEEGKHDITLSPFDGCGCHNREFSQRVSAQLELNYLSIGAQIRLPLMKGYSVMVDFKSIFEEMGVSQITDAFGNLHNIEEIDCIWNTSMFKGYASYKQHYGREGWMKYLNALKKYEYKLGISKYSHHVNDLERKTKMNFQYLQCLDLWNPNYVERFERKQDDKYDILDPVNAGKIINLAKYTTELYQKIIKGDKFYLYKFLGLKDTEHYDTESRYIEAALINDKMLHDPALKQYIYRKLKKAITQMKFGKIYVDGFYHTVVSDMIGYLEFAAGLTPTGCLKAGEFYAQTLKQGKAISMRSPLVCPSEVNEIELIQNAITDRWFAHFKDQDVVMINMYDMSMPQQGGMDADGDAVLLCNDPTIVNSKINKTMIIDVEDKVTAKKLAYTKENITEYELNSRDNRIGEITNVATSILNKYTKNSDIQQVYDDYISLLRIFQGKEIDFIKTGMRWQMNRGLRKHLNQLPFFLLHNYPKKLDTYNKQKQKNKSIDDPQDQVKLNGYRSPAPMNELNDYITAWEQQKIVWDRSYVNTSELILDHTLDLNDKDKFRAIRRVINQFTLAFKELMRLEQDNKQESDLSGISSLIDIYHDKMRLIIPDKTLLANYVIKVSYSNTATSKFMAWNIFGDHIIKNLKINTPNHTSTCIKEVPEETPQTYEYLGKYYLMEEMDYV